METAIKWIVLSNQAKDIENYMAKHRKEENADDLWEHFKNVVEWAKKTFPTAPKYEKWLKGVEWGILYDKYKNEPLDSKQLEKTIDKLMADEEVRDKKGIYAYVLDGDESHLNLRQFDPADKQTALSQQGNKCKFHKKPTCPTKGKILKFKDAHADHIRPWRKGGKTTFDNLQILCKKCNERKSDKE